MKLGQVPTCQLFIGFPLLALILVCCASKPPNDLPTEGASSRPALRQVLKPHPDTLKKHLTPEILAEAKAYLASRGDLPSEVRQAINTHEVWLGMTAEEVRLAIGEPTGSEKLSEKPGGHALTYSDEGWVLRFDEKGYLYELVER